MEDQETLVCMGEGAEVLPDSEAFCGTINLLVNGCFQTYVNTWSTEAEKQSTQS